MNLVHHKMYVFYVNRANGLILNSISKIKLASYLQYLYKLQQNNGEEFHFLTFTCTDSFNMLMHRLFVLMFHIRSF